MKTKTKTLSTLINSEIAETSAPVNPLSSIYQLYKNADFEIYIAANGSVSASQSAMARMLGMQQGHLSSVLNRAVTAGDISAPEVATVTIDPRKNTTAIVSLYDVATIRKMAIKYNPALADKFGEMGATVYLYQLAGYKVTPVTTDLVEPVEFLPKATNANYNDYLETAHVALGKLLNLHRFAEDKPGLESYLLLAENAKGKTFGGKMTLDEMAESFGIELKPEHSRLIGRAMAGVSRSQEEQEPTQIRKRVKNSAGNHQSYYVTEYSTDYLPLFESLCRAYRLI